MKRDGAKTSLWQHMAAYNSQAAATTNEVFDVMIVGGGVTGITTALRLQKSGKRCIVAEAHNLCFGTTGGTTSHLNSFFDTSYHQVQKDFGEDGAQLLATAATQAIELYQTNIEQHAIDCGYEVKDGYLYAQTEDEVEELEKIFTASKAAGVDVAWSDRIPVNIPFLKALVYHDQAQVHPSQYVYGLAKAFEEAGGVILQQCVVEDFKGDAELEINTSKGVFKARHLIWATHIPPGVNILHFRNAPYRSYAMALTLSDGAYPDGLAYDMKDPYHYYRTQMVDGKPYLIAGGEDHKTAHEENTDACFTKLEAYLRKYFRIDTIAYSWSSQFFEPADGLAYIGHLPGNPDNVFVATGFGGNGMIYSHVAAITLTDLIVNGRSDYEKLFSPARIKPVAGFANFVKENVDVVKEFIGKRLDREKIESMAAIAPGEAKLVKLDGKAMAIYKDEQGGIHAVSTVCPHAKCSVGWNSAEKSWDCPCHGSRFDIDGEVLTGPARQGLEVIAVEQLAERKEE